MQDVASHRRVQLLPAPLYQPSYLRKGTGSPWIAELRTDVGDTFSGEFLNTDAPTGGKMWSC